jgi:hypothetical protein
MNLEIVSFFSDVDGSTYYSDHAERLIAECNNLGVSYDIREKPSEGSYQKNCLSKPKFLLDMLMTKRKPFVWLDVDSYLLKQPNIFDSMIESHDVAFATALPSIGGVKASPIFINNTTNAEEFLISWVKNAEITLQENMKHFDHESLFGLVEFYRKRIRVGFAGPDYCAWPKSQNENTVIMMGLSDVESKKVNLRAMGISEDKIEWQSVGTL